MSSDEHPTDPDKARADGSPVGEESHSVQQDAEQPSTSDTASVAAVTNAASGMGRPSADPSQDSATPSGLPDPSNENDGLRIQGQPDDDHARSLAEALDLLRGSVHHLITKKRRTTAAAVSLEMRRRSGNTFTPAAAGFAAFREFLRFAEGVGAVTLLPPVPGGDIEVLSPTAEGTVYEPTTPPMVALRPIRRDLWQAFVDWSPQLQRAFDVRTSRVVTLPADRNGGSGVDASEERRAWQEDPDRFRRIVPLSREDQLQWMRVFVSQLPAGAERDQLDAALDDDYPLTAFVRAIRVLPDVQRSWRRTFTEQVTSAITRWMRQEQLTVDIYHMPSAQSGEPARHVSTVGAATASSAQQSIPVRYKADSSDELRRQVLEAVARMSLSELLRLPIPAEYLLRQ